MRRQLSNILSAKITVFSYPHSFSCSIILDESWRAFFTKDHQMQNRNHLLFEEFAFKFVILKTGKFWVLYFSSLFNYSIFHFGIVKIPG